ncbi:MAG: hypothetical protein ACW99V_03720, partial [Candidatus Thorarchaeota archaeon]
MRTCAKCGKANDIMRRHCTRCGASLLKVAEEPKSETSAPLPETGSEVSGAEVEEVEAPAETPIPEEIGEVTPDVVDIEEKEEVESPEPTSLEMEEGKEVVKSILQRVKEAEDRKKEEEAALQPETDVEPLEEE